MREMARRPLRIAPLSTIVLVMLAGCSPEFGGEVKIDGEAFKPSSCRSGQVNGFAGADLLDESNRTLRIVQSPTNQPQVILLAGDQVVDLGQCGTMTLSRQNSTVNDIVNVEGEATLKCSAGGHTVEGTVSFKNCH